ncbi:DUF2000 domain-containing protein [Algicola sagamiensis]|uniref:DUF2000 domain-containing protein n=1 Tax=Algicola sagamiensis TaxID=163869 RepID=UPI00037E33A6|nr:DUF2000 domain-containing protein [Algicola sagamiensis]
MSEKKCVLILDSQLPPGILANAASVLSVSLGRFAPEMVGEDMVDQLGDTRKGITTIAIPILKGDGLLLRQLREALKPYEDSLIVVDVTGATRTTRSYAEYQQAMRETPIEQTEYLGIALYGDKKLVNKFSGNLGLLR